MQTKYNRIARWHAGEAERKLGFQMTEESLCELQAGILILEGRTAQYKDYCLLHGLTDLSHTVLKQAPVNEEIILQ
jgi:hypothetical protein